MATDAAAGIFGLMWLFFILLWIAGIIIGILGFIFWIFMILDVAKREFPKKDDKIIWLLIVILAGLIGAIIYYFVIKRKDTISKQTQKSIKSKGK